jgi:hypothetical protein
MIIRETTHRGKRTGTPNLIHGWNSEAIMPKSISSKNSGRLLLLGCGFTLESLASSLGVVYIAHKIGLWLAIANMEGRTLGRLDARVLGEPYFLLPIALAIVLSAVVNRNWQHSFSRWVWILPVVWLLYMISENIYWDWYRHLPEPAVPLGREVWDNFFGPGCGSSECFDEWLATAPFYASVAYSLVAWVIYKTQNPQLEPDAEPARH